MTIDIGQLFSRSWEVIKQRVWLLLGMYVLFFVIQIVFSGVLGVIMGGSAMAFAGVASGMDSPAGALGGLGVGFIVMMVVMYLGYFVIVFAQQCAMSALATPLRQTPFGDAIGIGFKGGLTFLLIVLLGILAYIGFVVVGMIVGFLFSVLGDIGGILVGLLFLLLIPGFIYLALRMAVLVPVVAVDRETGPILAITRTWALTRGHALSIFVIYLIMTGIALVLVAVPLLMIFGSLATIGETGDPTGAIGALLGISLLLIPLFLIYGIVSTVITACLHAAITDRYEEGVEDTFA